MQVEEEKLVLAVIRRNIENLLLMQKNMQDGEKKAVGELERISKRAAKMLKEERKGRVEDMVHALQQELRVPGSKVAKFIFEEGLDRRDNNGNK